MICACCNEPTEMTSHQDLCLDCQAEAEEYQHEQDQLKEECFEAHCFEPR